MHETSNHYHDLVLRWFTESISVTFSHGISIDRVATIFGDRGTGHRYTYSEAKEQGHEAFQDAGIGCTAIVGELGEWVVTVEPEGFEGNLWHILQPLSEFDRAISLLCAFGTYDLSYALRSQLVADLHLWDYSERSTIESSELDRYLYGLDFPADDVIVKVSALSLCERITGVRLDSEWLNRRHRWLIWEE